MRKSAHPNQPFVRSWFRVFRVKNKCCIGCALVGSNEINFSIFHLRMLNHYRSLASKQSFVICGNWNYSRLEISKMDRNFCNTDENFSGQCAHTHQHIFTLLDKHTHTYTYA